MNGIKGYISILEASYRWVYRSGGSINTALEDASPALPVSGDPGQFRRMRKSRLIRVRRMQIE